MDPFASVVIPAYNAQAVLPGQLAALAGQRDAPAFEVVVVDNRSTTSPQPVVDAWGGLLHARLVRAFDAQGVSYARNVGLSAARGRYVLICDADDEVGPRWVAAHCAALEGGVALSTGPLEVCHLNDPVYAELFLGGPGCTVEPYPVSGYLPFAYGANMGMHRVEALKLGGFDTSMAGGGDDEDFSWRAQEAGWPLIVSPDALVHYRLRPDPQALYRQHVAYARGTVQLRYKQPARLTGGVSARWIVAQGLRIARTWPTTSADSPERLRLIRDWGAVVGNAQGLWRHRLRRQGLEAEHLGIGAP